MSRHDRETAIHKGSDRLAIRILWLQLPSDSRSLVTLAREAFRSSWLLSRSQRGPKCLRRLAGAGLEYAVEMGDRLEAAGERDIDDAPGVVGQQFLGLDDADALDALGQGHAGGPAKNPPQVVGTHVDVLSDLVDGDRVAGVLLNVFLGDPDLRRLLSMRCGEVAIGKGGELPGKDRDQRFEATELFFTDL